MKNNFPRLIIAATQSGSGKTTITAGLIGVLKRRGLDVQPYKLAAHDEIPYIAVAGTKGGSSIAVAAVNAILYMLDDSRGIKPHEK